ncbi:MAG TPA: 4Fe-4S dicluster domain-containing protein [Polyangiaceae bacterium]
MSYWADTWDALFVTLRNAVRPPVTVEFPRVVRERPERYRTSFALLHDEQGDELCIGCMQCERICPSSVITVKAGGKRESKITGKKRGYADDLTLDKNACLCCELCVQVCPTDALVMLRTPDKPGYAREDLVLTMDKLYENEKQAAPSWGNGSRLMKMQEPPQAPAKKREPGAPAPEPKVVP